MATKKVVRVDRSLVAVPREGRGRFRRRYHRREMATKGVLLVAGAGAIVALLANLDDIKNSDSVKSHWWLLPLGVLAIGYMLRKRGNPYGSAVLAVGGALFAIAYQLQSKNAQAAPKSPQSPAPQQFAPDVQGPYLPPMADVGALPSFPGNTPFTWIRTPTGELVRIALPSGLGFRKGNMNSQRSANAVA